MRILGIDPGKYGAFVILDNKELVHYCVTPLKDNSLDLVNINREISRIAPTIDIAYLEKVSGWAGKGSMGMFNFGKTCGSIEMALVSNKIHYKHVSPKSWQKDIYGDTAGKGKQRSEIAFSRLFKDTNLNDLTKKQKEGIWDASLIAEYGRRENEKVLDCA